MTVLITGIAGFVGSHLVDYLFREHPHVRIVGLMLPKTPLDLLAETKDRLEFFEGDLLDTDFVERVLRQARPDKIFHLAAMSAVQDSWGSANKTFTNNIISQCNIFETIRHLQQEDGHYQPVIQIAGSSEEYGLVKPAEVPITEENPLRPLSPYAVSKITQDYMGYQYMQSYGLRVIRTRAFNHSGPRRPPTFVDSSFARQVADIEKGRQDPIIDVGNLEAIRDFSDVRDVVEAYWLATEKALPGEVYNIASGLGIAVKDVLKRMLELSKVKKITVRQDPKRIRPSDVPILIGNAEKFSKRTGWHPKISYLETTLPDMLNYWREKP